jgi:hypothetical protein
LAGREEQFTLAKRQRVRSVVGFRSQSEGQLRRSRGFGEYLDFQVSFNSVFTLLQGKGGNGYGI